MGQPFGLNIISGSGRGATFPPCWLTGCLDTCTWRSAGALRVPVASMTHLGQPPAALRGKVALRRSSLNWPRTEGVTANATIEDGPPKAQGPKRRPRRDIA